MDDLISRQVVIDVVRSYMADNMIEDSDWHADGIAYDIKRLPSAEPKTGHWILKQSTDSGITHWECSECKTTNYTGYTNYCPSCGAKMK